MFFRRDYSTPGPGIDPNAPEKTGLARFIEILTLEAPTLLKLNLLFLAASIPVVTLPLAVFGMNQVIRKMMLDEPVLCFYDYRTAIKRFWKQAYAAFFLTAAPLLLSGVGAYFYLRRAEGNIIMFAPFVVCSTVFLVTLLGSAYLYGVLSTGENVRRSLRLSLALGLGKPLRAVLAVLFYYAPLLAAVLAFPVSALYLLLIGFSAPCFVGNFFLRTVIKKYCNVESKTGSDTQPLTEADLEYIKKFEQSGEDEQ